MDDNKDYSFTGYNKNLKESCRVLRKNMTPQEKDLWYHFLKNYPIRFNRQRSIGKYIVDFYCSKAKLVVEIDGSQHYTEKGKEYDDIRAEEIEKYGVKVIRFSNYDVDNAFEGVCIEIEKAVKQRIGDDKYKGIF